jgi:hypothetical protein
LERSPTKHNKPSDRPLQPKPHLIALSPIQQERCSRISSQLSDSGIAFSV